MTESKTAFQAFASLLGHAANGDQNARQELIARIHPQVFSFAREHTSTLQGANALASQIEQEVIHSLNELDSVKRFYPWVKEIENRVLTTKEVYPPMESQQSQLLAGTIQQLTDDQKTVFQLYYGERKSISDISRQMHLDEEVVTGILEQAKKKISDSVIQMEKEEGLKTYDLAPIPLILYMLFHYTKTDAIAEGGTYPTLAMASETYEPSVIQMNQSSKITPKAEEIETPIQNANQNIAVENSNANIVRNTANANTVVKKAGKHIAAKVVGGVLAGAVALDAGGYAYYQATTDDQSKKDFVTWNAGLITNITNDVTFISTPEKTIEELENAFNDRDLNGLIACFDPEFQSYYRKLVEFGDALSGEDTDYVFSMLFSAMTGESGLVPQTIDLEVISTEENEDTAVCKIQITAHFAGSEDISYEDTIDMIQEDDEWYIDSGVSDMIE